MSDTITITPEEKAELRELADKSYLLPLNEDEVPGVGFDGLTDERIAYIAAACNSVPRLLDALEQAEARAEKAEAENARLRERLESALDKIADIEEDSNAYTSKGACHACGICAGCPEDWEPTDDHCCRVMLELWADGEPLPWEACASRSVADSEVKG